jgi:RNA polymerase sigma-70 factor (sigma-E family)
MTDEHALADFIRNRAVTLYRYGYLLTGNHYDAEDLVQDALIRLRAHWSRVAHKDDPIAYVRTIMARLHISKWRRRRRELLTGAVPEKAVADPGLDRVDAADDGERVWAALVALPPKQRAVIVLRFYESLTDEEIAATLGVSRSTVRSQASRALQKLRAGGAAELSGVGERMREVGTA